MPVFNNILAGASGSTEAAAFRIDRSLRFNRDDSAYLNRTPSSAGNRKTWTWSGWVKQSDVSTGYSHLFAAGTGLVCRIAQNPGGNRRIHFMSFDGSNFTWQLVTTAEFRDPSAWYHLVFVLDTTQSTASDRAKIYVNGVLQTEFNVSTYPTQDYQDTVNNTVQHKIGDFVWTFDSNFFLDGYLADVNFIDGQALAASDFGEYDDNNVWQPIEYAGTYGTNGFHLDFSDNTSTTTIAEDSSGNNNDWTANNISVASGADNDSLIDTPTNYTASGNNGGNYATLNPLALPTGATLSNGNLEFDSGTGGYTNARSTIGVSSGKWYAEFDITVSPCYIGVALDLLPNNIYGGDSVYGWVYHPNGSIYHNSVATSYGASFGTDLIGVALDADNRTVTWYKNGVSQGSYNLGSNAQAGDTFFFVGSGYVSDAYTVNFGQRPFAYTPPTGYVSLCTQNLDDPTIADGSTTFDAVLYTGNGTSTQVISGYNFSPDFVWIKKRSSTGNNSLFDIIRGTTKFLYSNSNAAEATGSQGLKAFNSDGFTTGSSGDTGQNNQTYVAWAWDAGTTTDTNNTDGTITPTGVRANQDSGFSIITYTGTGSAATVPHGLGAKPHFYVVKKRNSTGHWVVYHEALGATHFLRLSTTVAQIDQANVWNDTEPTTSVFSVGGDTAVNNSSDTYVAYCFAPVEGYSAFGSYTGNGSTDGPFIYTGFRPAFLMTKTSSTTGNWHMHDTSRSIDNPAPERLFSNLTNAEQNTSAGDIDILSNGFKLKNSTAGYNANNVTHVWAAFAEHPFKTARAR